MTDRKRYLYKALLVITGVLTISLTACTNNTTSKLYSNAPITIDENAENTAELFRQLAQARLGKPRAEIESIADKLLTEDSKSLFMKYYTDYMQRLSANKDYIIIEQQYKDATDQYNYVKSVALEHGLIDESGNLTEKATGDKTWLTGDTQQPTQEQAQPTQEQAEAQTQEATEPQPTETADTQTQEATEPQPTEPAETQAQPEETEQDDELPRTKEGLLEYVDYVVDYIGEGDEVVEMSESRETPFLLLGWSSLSLDETIEPISMATFENSTYEEMATRARQIIYLYKVDLQEFETAMNSYDTRTEEERQADLELTKKNYQDYLAYADSQKVEDTGDAESFEIPLQIMALVYDYNFVDPETSSYIKVNEEGKHVIYWEDLANYVDNFNMVNFTVLGQDFILDLKPYEKPMEMYKNNEYTTVSWRLWQDLNTNSEYPYRVLQGLQSDDIKSFDLLIEYKIDSNGKVMLTEDQIKAILDIQ